jgi:serine/threonine protein kinase
LILVGHSLGGILIKAAFVRASQDETYSALRHTLGGLVFIGTPHEGIQNDDWADVWGDQPSGILVRDLAPGSSFLRDLRESFKQHLLQEKILTVFEHRETRTIHQKEDGKLDRNGKPVLRIDEKAACVLSDNEVCVGIDEDHSKIARLQNSEGSPYHTIKSHMQIILSNARSIISIRILRRSIHGVILRLRTYFQHILMTSTQPPVLLLAECSDLNALCDILDQPDDLLSGLASSMTSLLVASRAAEKLGDLFREAIIEASCKSGALRKQLQIDADSFWSVPTKLEGPIFATTPVHMEDLINAAVPLILDVKESLSAALSAQDSSILRAFIESDQAKHLGLHLIVQRRELLSQSEIRVAQPSAGHLIDISERNGLTIGTFYSEDGLAAQRVIVETRSYKMPGSDQLIQKQRKEASQELAAILRDVSFSSQEKDQVRRRLSPAMSIFEFEGYIDDTEAELLNFMYRIPAQLGFSSQDMINRSRSLAYWIRDTGDGPPYLEERYAVAYHLCHTVFNQHVSGWVHKSIRPDNVILIPTRIKESELVQNGRVYTHVPYLKGFELSRKMNVVSDRVPARDTNGDVYIHPNRRGHNIMIQFRPVHDLYALGVLLVEIGTGKPILTSINSFNEQTASNSFEDNTMRIAKEKLPRNLGTRYAECAVRC